MAIKRVHVALNCTDLKASIDFYSRFFATAPTKIKEDYAKFELTNPNLHFSLNVLPFEKFGVLSHLGFQVDHAEDVFAMGEHLRQANLLTIHEMNTTCCYSVQDKVWVFDPDGNAWEFFYTKEDVEMDSDGVTEDLSLCCTPPPSTPFTSLKRT